MTETASQKKGRALAEGAQTILQDMPASYTGLKGDDLVAARELLTMAILLLDGKPEAREKKNAADRARRAKPKPMARSKPKKKSKGWGAALTGGETDIG